MNETILQMRLYLDEVVPEGKMESDTRFADVTLQSLFDASLNLYKAVSIGWTLKAGMLARELGHIDEYSSGSERYRNINLTTAINAAHSMAKRYEELSAQGGYQGGFMLKVETPEVI